MNLNSSTLHSPSNEAYQVNDSCIEYPLSEELADFLDARSIRVDPKILDVDGKHIQYQVLGAHTGPCLVLANGLGGRFYTWLSLIETVAPHMKIISWDYRGLFHSYEAHEESSLRIGQHAEDLKLILDQEQVKEIHLAGWSMGVQVSLEFATRYPTYVQSLMLLNGSYGHVFSTAFQPLLPLPSLSTRLHHLSMIGSNIFE